MRFIEITPDDIRNGRPGDPRACAVALASKREFPGMLPAVGHGKLKLKLYDETGRVARVFFLSERLEKFIFDFDAEWPVVPGFHMLEEFICQGVHVIPFDPR